MALAIIRRYEAKTPAWPNEPSDHANEAQLSNAAALYGKLFLNTFKHIQSRTGYERFRGGGLCAHNEFSNQEF
jgi:hypothetical protein